MKMARCRCGINLTHSHPDAWRSKAIHFLAGVCAHTCLLDKVNAQLGQITQVEAGIADGAGAAIGGVGKPSLGINEKL